VTFPFMVIAGTVIGGQRAHLDDRYEDAMRDLIKRKAAGEKIEPAEHPKPKATINLMDALRASVEGTRKRPPAQGGELTEI
jgi:DNA end-binding protein Ku